MQRYDKTTFRYDTLNMMTAQLDDLEGLRIAIANRHRIMTTPLDKVDEDGVTRGLGLRAGVDPELIPVQHALAEVIRLEAYYIKEVEGYMRKSPWADFLKDPMTKGVGAKQLARLLGAIGDPAWHTNQDRPRKVTELWSYCGYSVVSGAAPRREKGKKATWSSDARSRARMIAESCLKAGGHYRVDIYDPVKAHYQGAIHTRECVQCGKAADKKTGAPGVPALPTTPLKDGHIHARALRAISKELLRDLWIEARRHRGLSVELGAPLDEVA
jgi:hypothetical protein